MTAALLRDLLYAQLGNGLKEQTMTDFDRRAVVGGLTVAGLAAVSTSANAAPSMLKLADIKKEADVACVYHCDFGETPRFAQVLNNISNHYSVYGNPLEVQLAIVAHSAGVRYFLTDWVGSPWKDEALDPGIFERVQNVAKDGLKVYLCDITFQRLKLDRAKVRNAEFISFVPSGVATVAALQSKGFGYIKIG